MSRVSSNAKEDYDKRPAVRDTCQNDWPAMAQCKTPFKVHGVPGVAYQMGLDGGAVCSEFFRGRPPSPAEPPGQPGELLGGTSSVALAVFSGLSAMYEAPAVDS